VIVVEDGTEGVAACAPGIRLLRLARVGRSPGRGTRGVEAASTPFVAFLDEDDVCLAGRLDRQRDALERAPDATMAYGRVVVVDARPRPIDEWNENLARASPSSSPAAPASTRLRRWEGRSTCRRRWSGATRSSRAAASTRSSTPTRISTSTCGSRATVASWRGASEPVTLYRVHDSNTPSEALYRGTLGVTAKHLAAARGPARRALLDRRIDALWSLGEFRAARREAVNAAVADPRLLGHPRFVKRLLALAARRGCYKHARRERLR
jgi:hypothetical protein